MSEVPVGDGVQRGGHASHKCGDNDGQIRRGRQRPATQALALCAGGLPRGRAAHGGGVPCGYMPTFCINSRPRQPLQRACAAEPNRTCWGRR